MHYKSTYTFIITIIREYFNKFRKAITTFYIPAIEMGKNTYKYCPADRESHICIPRISVLNLRLFHYFETRFIDDDIPTMTRDISTLFSSLITMRKPSEFHNVRGTLDNNDERIRLK